MRITPYLYLLHLQRLLATPDTNRPLNLPKSNRIPLIWHLLRTDIP